MWKIIIESMPIDGEGWLDFMLACRSCYQLSLVHFDFSIRDNAALTHAVQNGERNEDLEVLYLHHVVVPWAETNNPPIYSFLSWRQNLRFKFRKRMWSVIYSYIYFSSFFPPMFIIWILNMTVCRTIRACQCSFKRSKNRSQRQRWCTDTISLRSRSYWGEISPKFRWNLSNFRHWLVSRTFHKVAKVRIFMQIEQNIQQIQAISLDVQMQIVHVFPPISLTEL